MKTYLTIEIVHKDALPALLSDAIQERAYTYLHNKGIRCQVSAVDGIALPVVQMREEPRKPWWRVW